MLDQTTHSTADIQITFNVSGDELCIKLAAVEAPLLQGKVWSCRVNASIM